MIAPIKSCGLFLMCLLSLASQSLRAAPPFSGTIFIDPDIITAADATTFISAPYAGQGMRQMYDRRVNSFITSMLTCSTRPSTTG
jgi:hypothetical protein